MRVVSTITTPWAPYSVMFSRDGTRLAVGGGSWYGEGGILLADLSSQETRLLPCANLPAPGRQLGPFTVSGVCFSPDDLHLAASTWSSRHHYGPTLLYGVDGLRLLHRQTLVHRYRDDIGDPCPTGVLLTGDYAITRNNTSILGDVFATWPLPRRLKAHADAAPHHLTSSQLAVIRGSVFTGGGGSRALSQWRADLGMGEIGKAADGIVMLPLGADAPSAEVIPVRECRRLTAIGPRPTGEGFVTGGRAGELDAWSWDGRWVQTRLRPATNHPQPPIPNITWATYTPDSIVGICHLPGGDRWASVSAGGEVCVWDEDALACTWQLPESGTPRSLAAHPDRPWIAVGVKKGGFGRPQSAVVIAEVDSSTLDPTWRMPTVLGLARAAVEERISPDGPLDPERLAILADAMEDAGCADARLLGHLRNHDRRLRDCWVIAGLLGKAQHPPALP